MNDTRREVLDRIGEGPIAGPRLADDLGVSRTAVWKHVEALREAGFEIESDEEGYALVGIPEYGAGAVEARLDGSLSVEYHGATDSTNARAREIARQGRSDVVVIADEQTGGRGRLDREWASPSGGIWMSALVRPDLPPARVPILTLAAAVAVAETLNDRGVDTGLKWPNDVLHVDEHGTERKLSGILTEMEGETDEVSWVIVGIGVNANVDAEALPAGATSLREAVGDVNRGEVVAGVLDRFDALRTTPEAVLPAWRDLSVTLGRRVRVRTGNETIVGEAVEVASPGRLRVDTGEESVWVHAGDCEHLRPAGEPSGHTAEPSDNVTEHRGHATDEPPDLDR